jgi:hypothetical protein
VFFKAFALYITLFASLPSVAVEAQGFVRPESCSLYEPLRGDGLHLTSLDGQRPRKEVVLVFPNEGSWYYLLNTWYDTTGAYCPSGDCERITHAKFRIQHIHSGTFIPFRGRRINGVSGDFSVEFHDGRKLEGTFKAKARNPVQQLICE